MTPSKATARPELVELPRSRFADRVVPAAPPSRGLTPWEAAWAAFLDHKRTEVSEGSIRGVFLWAAVRIDQYRQAVTPTIQTPADFTDEHMYHFEEALAKTGLTAASRVKIVRGVLGPFLRWCQKGRHGVQEWKRDVPELPRIKLEKWQPPRLTDGEVARVLAHCGNERDEFLIRFGLMTGLRVGEIGAARGPDEQNHHRDSFLKVSSVSRDYTSMYVYAPKTKTHRTVPIPRELSPVLRDYVDRVRPKGTRWEGLFLTLRRNGSEPVPLTTDGIKVLCTRLRHQSGVERFHYHNLRHTYARVMAAAGMSPWDLQQVMGHASITTTMRYVDLEHPAVVRNARAIVWDVPWVHTQRRLRARE